MKTRKVSENEINTTDHEKAPHQSMIGGMMGSVGDGGGGGNSDGGMSGFGGQSGDVTASNFISAGNGFWDSLTAGLPLWMNPSAPSGSGSGSGGALIIGLLAIGLVGGVIYAIMNSRKRKKRSKR